MARRLERADKTDRRAEPYGDDYNGAYTGKPSDIGKRVSRDIVNGTRGMIVSKMRNPYEGTVPGAVSVEYYDFTPDSYNPRLGYIIQKVHKLMKEANDIGFGGIGYDDSKSEVTELGPDDSVSQAGKKK